jgi:tRNA dimethylallyltransferase
MKAIFIVGPTATGKTDLAIHLANFLLKQGLTNGVDILSADSKQVYLDEDIVTGKDKQKFQDLDAHIRVFGIDVVNPDEEWSLSHFLKYAKGVVANASELGHVLVVVGGTGLYLSSLVVPPDSAVIERDEKLRHELDSLGVSELQTKLKSIKPDRYEQMNNSDRNNPRRLVRAIEVALSSKGEVSSTPPIIENPLVIGLDLDKEKLEERIKSRVQERLSLGAIQEVKTLQKKYPNWRAEARSAIGYLEIEEYLLGKISENQLLELWSLHESQYAKRQKLWFEKKLPVEWYLADDEALDKRIEARVENWYTQN